jgi:hypothetical protein
VLLIATGKFTINDDTIFQAFFVNLFSHVLVFTMVAAQLIAFPYLLMCHTCTYIVYTAHAWILSIHIVIFGLSIFIR